MVVKQKAQIIKNVCDALLAGDKQKAIDIAQRDWPFVPPSLAKTTLNDTKRTQVFIRDGFIDRYSGAQLVYPGAIILLSHLLPKEFPSHPSWKMSESHIFYWELWPTIDHVIPRARGGTDAESNLVCTSMIRNSAKANWLLEEIEWKVLPPGDFDQWDGMIHWFTEYMETHAQNLENTLANKEIKKWYATAKRCLPHRM